MSRDKITLYNNRLGITTLAAPKDLPAPMRAALQATLRMEPGGSVTLDRDIVALMMRCPGNWPLVESGEISTRREETERRRPPTNLRKVPPSALGAPKGVSDFVMGLRPDGDLLRMVQAARQQRATMRPRAQASRVDVPLVLAGVPAGDYQGLLENLAAKGVSMDDLRAALGVGTVPPPVPLGEPTDESIPSPPPPVPLDEPSASADDHHGADGNRPRGRQSRKG
jgi:hypothetical protein